MLLEGHGHASATSRAVYDKAAEFRDTDAGINLSDEQEAKLREAFGVED